MQQILRAYGRLPSNPGNRAALYTGLFDLSKSLGDDEVLGIESWLQNGGIPDDFPTPKPATPVTSTSSGATEEFLSEEDNVEAEVEDEGEWPEYNPAAFESDDAEMENSQSHGYDEPEAVPQLNDEDSAVEDAHTGDEIPDEEEITGSDLEDIDFQRPRIPYTESEKPENECQVCYEAIASADLLAPSKLTSTCDHDEERRSCLPCLAEHIDITLERFALHAINCPFCDETLSHEEVKKYATPAAFTR